MGLFAEQKWCISGNPGNTLSGHHLSAGNPSVCSQGMPCQVLWSGMLRLGRGGQRFFKTRDVDKYLSDWTLFITYMRPAKQPRPQTVQWLMPDCKSHFSLPKGGLTPDPRTFTKMSAILLQTPLVSCWHQRGAFGNPLSGRDFHPGPPCPPGHLPPQTEFAGVLIYT